MNDPMAGMHWMLVTPFDQREEVDTSSLGNLVNKAAESGCIGVVALGEMGEWRRLTDGERGLVLEKVMVAAKGRLKVTVGTTAASTYVAVQRAQEAQEAGASAIMVAPPPLAKPNPVAVETYYQRIAQAVDIPLVIQDFPQASGVHMSPQFIAQMAKGIPSFKYLKLEDPPTPTKISRIRHAAGDGLGIFGGLGGAFLLDELARGGIGAMTGFAYPEVLVEVIRRYFNGDVPRATELFNRFLPLIMFENQEGINLSIRKEAIKARGLMPTAVVRHPAGSVDDAIRRELSQLIEALEPASISPSP